MTDSNGSSPTVKRSIWWKLYNGETNIQFIAPFKKWLVISGVVIFAGLVSLGFRGLNFGIDFRGGTAWEVPTKSASVETARDALRPLGLSDAKIQVLGGNILRVQADPSQGTQAEQETQHRKVAEVLAKAEGIDVARVSVNEVGPSWGTEITNKALRALIAFLIVITIYISLRFEPKMAVACLAALVHDILVTVGVYSLSGFEVTPATVVAFLTILGYSLYDGIVVFDKVEENTRGLAASGRMTYSDMVNLSMNQVMMRSLNTSITALLPIFSVLFVGAFAARGDDVAGLRPRTGHRLAGLGLLVDLHRLAAAGRAQGARTPIRDHPPAPRGQGFRCRGPAHARRLAGRRGRRRRRPWATDPRWLRPDPRVPASPRVPGRRASAGSLTGWETQGG